MYWHMYMTPINRTNIFYLCRNDRLAYDRSIRARRMSMSMGRIRN